MTKVFRQFFVLPLAPLKWTSVSPPRACSFVFAEPEPAMPVRVAREMQIYG
jgi:hypothetical protein